MVNQTSQQKKFSKRSLFDDLTQNMHWFEVL